MKTLFLALFASLISLNAAAANRPARRTESTIPAQHVAQVAPSPLIATMGQELDREMPILSKATPPAYFISYILTSTDRSRSDGLERRAALERGEPLALA